MTPNQYYRVRPTEDEFDLALVERTFANWHTTDSTSRIPVLGSPPTLELLLVAPDDRTLNYYVGTDRNHADLERTLGQQLPKLEYDVPRDSLVRLQEYAGTDTDEVQELVEDGPLVRDCDHPHLVFTAEGREELQVGHREGIAYGHERGAWKSPRCT